MSSSIFIAGSAYAGPATSGNSAGLGRLAVAASLHYDDGSRGDRGWDRDDNDHGDRGNHFGRDNDVGGGHGYGRHHGHGHGHHHHGNGHGYGHCKFDMDNDDCPASP
jgi:hypothetical protein